MVGWANIGDFDCPSRVRRVKVFTLFRILQLEGRAPCGSVNQEIRAGLKNLGNSKERDTFHAFGPTGFPLAHRLFGDTDKLRQILLRHASRLSEKPYSLSQSVHGNRLTRSFVANLT